VCGTAIETGMDATVRLTVRKDVRIGAPQVDLPGGLIADQSSSPYRVCTGVGPDLMEASRDAVRAGIDFLGERYGLGREEAYALLSVAGDLRILEVVDAPNWVVGVFVPLAIFGDG
jgi:acetamidase/formamidase